MNAEIFKQSLRGAGLQHDVDLFLEAYRRTSHAASVVILVDGLDEALTCEAMIPILRYLSHLGVSPLLVSGIAPADRQEGDSFARRLVNLGAITRESRVRLADSWLSLLAPQEATEVHLVQADPDGSTDPVAALAERLIELQCRKLVLLDAQGIVFQEGEPKSILGIDENGDAGDILRGVAANQRKLVSLGGAVTKALADHGTTVSLASPLNILPELFTVRGAGTLFRTKARFSILRGTALRSEPRLGPMIERAFGRRLRTDRSPFDEPGAWGIIEDAGRAAALLIPTPVGHYMSKFAVIRECQGSGIGQELWREVRESCDRIFWRARNTNPINPWYARVTDGLMRDSEWTYYWRGLAGPEIERGRELAQNRPDDFEP